MLTGKEEIEIVLIALAEQLEDAGINHIEMLVCGGAALNVLGFVHRTTKDIDVIAFVEKEKDGKIKLIKAQPLRSVVIEAAQHVKKDFNLPDHWLNAGPASVMDFGLPEGLMERVETRIYGKILAIHFLSRYDQIHFKLYAAVDRGERHYDDLMALNPTSEELEQAARWSMTHDPSEGYHLILKDFLDQIGHKDVSDKL